MSAELGSANGSVQTGVPGTDRGGTLSNVQRRWYQSVFAKFAVALFLVLACMGTLNVLAVVLGWERLAGNVQQIQDWNLATEVGLRLMPFLVEEVQSEQIEQLLFDFHALHESREFYLLDSDGRILYSIPYERDTLPIPQIDPKFLQRVSAPIPPSLPDFGINPVNGRKALYSLGRTVISGKPGWVYIVLDSSTLLIERAGQQYVIRYALTMSVLAALVCGVSGLLLFGLLSRNFRRAVVSVQRIATGDLTCRIPVHGKDEIAELSTVVNAMSDRLVSALSDVQKTDALRRQFVATISHDLRTPLTVIEGYVELLRNSSAELEPAKRSRALELIGKNLASQKRLVADLFYLSRLEAQERAPEFGPFSLAELAYEVIEKLRPRAEELRIDLCFSPPERLPVVEGDIDSIERVVTNLCENAIKYSKPGSSVEVHLRSPGSDALEFLVVDQGLGIPPDELDRIGEPFFRARSGSSTREGSGLGLAIVKKILEAHNSSLEVASEVGIGSRFSFALKISASNRGS